ncbi:MAG: DUF2933 domain-containing protein [Gemmatimonadales bacterium]
MEWLQANWVWLLVILAFIGMHMGHGHGGHGGHGSRAEPREGGEGRGSRRGGCH